MTGTREQLGEPDEVGRGPRAQDAAAGEDHGPLGAGEELEDRPDVLRLGPDRRRPRGVELRLGRAAPRRGCPRARDRNAGPGRPTSAARTASPTSRGTSATAVELDRRARRGRRSSSAWSISWNASRPRNAALDLADEGEHRRRVLAGGVDPDREVGGADGAGPERTRPGRPVSWPWASAMNAAPPSWRVATTRMPAAWRPSSRPRKLSPGTVKAYRTPAARRASAMNRPTVRGPAGSAARRFAAARRCGLGSSRRLDAGSTARLGRRSSAARRGLGRRRLGARSSGSRPRPVGLGGSTSVDGAPRLDVGCRRLGRRRVGRARRSPSARRPSGLPASRPCRRSGRAPTTMATMIIRTRA